MDLYHYINTYGSDDDNTEIIKRNITIYILRHKNKELNYCYIGRTHNYELMNTQYKSNVKNPKNKTKLIECIRNTGGWNEWEMIELEKMDGQSKECVKIRQQEYIKQYNANLNVRNPVKQNTCKIKHKLQLARDKKKETLNKNMDKHVDKNKENADERKNKFVEKNKEKRQSQMNKNRELRTMKPFIIEEDEEDNKEYNKPTRLDEYISVWSNEFIDGIVKFKCSRSPPKKTSVAFYKFEFAKKIPNATHKELIYDILSKERINENSEFFRVNIQTVKNIFDLIDGEYYYL
jgi:hypothetical protein